MSFLEALEAWWVTLRVPVAAIIAVTWLLLVRNKGETFKSQRSIEEIKRSVPQLTRVDTAPEVATKVERTLAIAKKDTKTPKKFTRKTAKATPPPAVPVEITTTNVLPDFHVFYATQFNHTSNLAKHAITFLPSNTRLHNISVIPNLDDYFLQHPANAFYFVLLPSYANDSGPTQPLIEGLEETLNDFRVDANPLRTLSGFAVFGTGDKEGWPLKNEFCYQASKVEKLMERLGAKRVFAMGTGDVKGRSSLETQIEAWTKRVISALQTSLPIEPPIDLSDNEDEDSDVAEDDLQTPLLDVEDIGPVAQRHKSPTTDFAPKPMVSATSTTHAALTKQGYTIVGSHSGVKICRWTKSALRGRGSCYKFSFYGIKSHLCMETTPSLACANKCVFCWRHGTNPVGTTWRWQVDPPEVVYAGALEGHYKKINMLKGMMGVKPDRYEEAKRVRHCALSLVGEPIFCNSMMTLLI
jgi:tRNA wybutosine-synthesizing protein 1